jgi:hypothetical protein
MRGIDDSRRRRRTSGLTDRRAERAVLDRLIAAVRAGGSRVLVVRGAPGAVSLPGRIEESFKL